MAGMSRGKGDFMRFFTRVLLFLYSLCIAALTGVLIIVSVKPGLLKNLTDFMNNNFYKTTSSGLITIGILIIFLLISLYFIIKSLKSEKKTRSVSRNTDIGQIMISLSSIENLIVTSVKGTSGVREIKAVAKKFGNGLLILMKIGVYDDFNLPDFTEHIQRKVKSLVEESTGILVKTVRLQVDKIHVDSRLRKPEKAVENKEIEEKFIESPKEEEKADG
jgi:uncharacterized alkaline shock family protein YloU